MGSKSAIEWTDATWNPVSGCTKISPGCAYCYAEAITLRFKRGGPFLPGKSTIRVHPDRLRYPLSWKAPKRIFVNSMSDLFHEEVPLSFIQEVFSIMEQADRHIFQILTKRHERLAEVASQLPWPDNVWMGVSVENQYWAERRIPALKQVDAHVRFLSCEPLLRPLDLRDHLDGLQWVIVGGESGAKSRKMNPRWATDLRDQCLDADVPFFFKQWGGRTSKAGGRILDGQTWGQLPMIGSSKTSLSAEQRM
jgi:protein gp37